MFNFYQKKKKIIKRDLLSEMHQNVMNRMKKKGIDDYLNEQKNKEIISKVLNDYKNLKNRTNYEIKDVYLKENKDDAIDEIIDDDLKYINKSRELLKKDYPMELINETNRKKYIYHLKMIITSDTINELNEKEYKNLMLLADVYGLRKSEVIF